MAAAKTSLKILFILKLREDYNVEKHAAHKSMSTGLFNSATFVCNMLNECGIPAVLEVAVDNNSIDRLVRTHRPSHVIIEALWCVPTKFDVLLPLHPTVHWIIRMHSETSFIANEGIAVEWITKYLQYPRVSVAVNSPRFLQDLQVLFPFHHKRLMYLPNCYPQQYQLHVPHRRTTKLQVGCFGAIRPLKNQLLQAIAAIGYADKHQFQLCFHMNGDRAEMVGGPVKKNIISLFATVADRGHTLILHPWMTWPDFRQLCATMDVCMQVSLTETFCIVAADAISMGVPVVGSSEIPWLLPSMAASAPDVHAIIDRLEFVLAHSLEVVHRAQAKLTEYSFAALHQWQHELCQI